MPSRYGIDIVANTAQADQDIASTTRRVNELDKATDDAQQSTNALGDAFAKAAALAAGVITVETVRRSILYADALQSVQGRVTALTRETGDTSIVFRELQETARATGATLETSVDVFQRLTFAKREIGATNQELLQFVESIQQLGASGGASTAALDSGLTQLGQGLGSGILRAEEFNSILDNLPLVADRIAQGLGVTTGQLRQLVIDGKVLSRDVFDAILSQSEDIAREFEDLPPTISRSTSALTNATGELLLALDDALGITQAIAETFQQIAEDVSLVARQFEELQVEGPEIATLLGGADTAEEIANVERLAGIRRQAIEEEIAVLEKLQEFRGSLLDSERAQLFALREELRQLTRVQQIINEQRRTGTAPGPEQVEQVPGGGGGQTDAQRRAAERAARELARTQERIAQDFADRRLNLEEELQQKIQRIQIRSIEQAERINEAFVDDAVQREAKLIQNAELTQQEINRVYQDAAEERARIQQRELEKREAEERRAQEKAQRELERQQERYARTWERTFDRTFDALARNITRGEFEIADFVTVALDLIQQLLFPPGFLTGAGPLGGLFGGGGGLPQFQSGTGFVQQDGPAILHRGEAVLSASTMQELRNAGIGGGASNVSVNVINNGTPQTVEAEDVQIDGDQIVATIVTDDIRRGGPISRSLQGAFGVRR